MNEFLKIALFGAGGWALYRTLTGQSIIPTALPSRPAATPAPATTPAPAAVATAAVATTKAMVADAAKRALPANWNGMLTSHQWNYYYSQVRGVPGPDPGPLWPGVDTLNYQMPIDEWWSVVSTKGGLSGLGNYAYGRFIGGRVPYAVRGR